MNFKEFVSLFPATYTAFSEDKATRLAAALSYFTLFSLAPLLLILISLVAIFFGDEAARGSVQNYLISTMRLSEDTAGTVQELVRNASANRGNQPALTTAIGIGVALMGASGLFGALQDSLNTIWGVAPKPNLGITGVLRARFVSFAMVLGVGFLLLVSLLLTSFLSILTGFLNGMFGEIVWMADLINWVVGFVIATLLFAAIYKVLPDAEIKWHDVWIGALATSVLFTIGRYAISLYLERSATNSAYGSAGGIIVLLLWVNYASLILFFGAEFTKVYANKFGSKIQPSEHAVAVTDEARARQGLPAQQSHNPLEKPKSGALAATQNGAKPRISPEDARREFEWTLSVVAGAVLAGFFFLRRSKTPSNETSREVEIIEK